jgi:Xaa-Pro aminopeptidase
MFSASTYSDRRRALCGHDALSSGVVVLLGNEHSPMNAAANPHPFRQDSTFLYYLGIDVPGVDALIDLDTGQTRVFGDDPSLDDVVWMGERPSLTDHAARAGVERTAPRAELADALRTAVEKGRRVHLLPPYRDAHYRRIASLLGLRRSHVAAYVSVPLVDAVIAQRSLKSDAEIDQLETAVDTTAQLHSTAMEMAVPGTREQTIAGRLAGLAKAKGRGLSFPPTCSVRGEVLHNHAYENTLTENDLLLVDAGGTSPLHYAGDITRTLPVGGTFTPRQRRLYEAVLDAQTTAIEAIAPGVPFRDLHLQACTVLTEHLIDIGLMNGPADAAVAAGAHALFLPHGLGHMLGLDVHDMEALGEDRVGYADDQTRSDQFGLHTLRLARPLAPGFVVTVEPGFYVIPPLLARWRAEGRHEQFINYDAAADLSGFGGIRIEDDVLVTPDGARVLGPDLPKTASDVEARVPDA